MVNTTDTRVEKENQKLGTFGDYTVVNTRSVLNVSLCEERVENTAAGVVVYQGWAVIGSEEADAVWLISKLTYDANGYFDNRAWAEGEDTFDKVWASRATYNYSY